VFAQARYTFDLAGQALSESLIQFSHQSGLAIVFSDPEIRGISTSRVAGRLTPEEALDELLAGTDFTWRLIDDRIVAIYDGSCRNDDSCPENEQLLVMNPLYVPGIEELYVYGNRITGSRIKRSTLQGSAPVDVISSPDIELTGAQTLGEILRYLPAVSGNATSTAISNGGDGTATVTLRGLPASSTLVLINGRRVANDGLAGESVDLNTISPAAVQRIEVLKDGASAIYGSDAIAGVVNIIMKEDFYGLLLEQYIGAAQQGDADTTTTTLQYGTGFRNGSLFFSASYFDQDEIAARDRRISESADGRSRGGADLRSSATPSARVTLPDGQTVIRDAASGEYRPATDEDLFNFLDFTSSLVPSDRASAYLSTSYDFSELLTGKLELSYIRTKAKALLAPTPIFTAFEQQPFTVAADNIFNPFGVELEDVRRRLTELPPRQQQNKSETTRASFLLEGISGRWDWEWSFDWSKSSARETTSGVVNADNLRRGVGPAANCLGLEIDGCVPINLFGRPGSIDQQQLDYLRVPGKVRGESELAGTSFTAFTRLLELRHGPVEFAMGAEYRDESTRKKPDVRLANAGTIGGSNFERTSGDRRVGEVYFESISPLYRNEERGQLVDLELALRYSYYNDFGGTTNPKVGLRLQLNPAWLFRATYAQGFRAPTLNELFQGATESQAFISDPCTIQANVDALPGCSQLADDTRNQFLTVTGGNEDLEEEKSVSYGLGLVWTPEFLPGFYSAVDYFDIDTENVVGSSAQFIVNQNAALGLFEDQIVRDDHGNLQQVSAVNLNVGERRVQGIDLSLNYRLPTREWGQWSTALDVAYMKEYSIQLDRDSATVGLAGTFIDPASEGLGGLPEWKGTLGVQWARQRWRGSYDLHFISDMRETVPGTTARRNINSWVVQDVQFSYVLNVLRGLRVSLGIDNLLDKDPPFAASAFNDNFDGRSHELRGRFWYAKLSQRI
jgi:iron complex outermembrane receptor protein